ncbi:hypothetical protein [Sulfurovum sp.]|jgi:hypothetical protein|nr:hypothetical protein [Sulfurovum sp.]MDD2450848.1 hypothetical protein [Sulfurovum sp.]MDD3499334.1 hypothetical protein [Sulfurovum sp.]MDY0402146.1 hypothetical protein [Sulfurovum sp.]
MLKKFIPLIILGLFAIGAYFMKMGMDKAVNMANPTKTQKSE